MAGKYTDELMQQSLQGQRAHKDTISVQLGGATLSILRKYRKRVSGKDGKRAKWESWGETATNVILAAGEMLEEKEQAKAASPGKAS